MQKCLWFNSFNKLIMEKLFIDVLSFDDNTYCFDIEQIKYIKKNNRTN